MQDTPMVTTAAPENLPIRTISSLTGVNAITLRAWERRYGLIRPPRTAKGHRLYTHEHVEEIRRVLALLERGVPISQVRGQLRPDTSPRHGAGPWARYLHDPDARGIGTVRYPRLVPRDDDCAKKLAKRFLTNLYNERPKWLDLAHKKFDAAVFAAYGWPADLTDEEIPARLLALNLERAGCRE